MMRALLGALLVLTVLGLPSDTGVDQVVPESSMLEGPSCGNPSTVKDAMVFKLTLSDTVLGMDNGLVRAAADKVMTDMLWPEISSLEGAEKYVESEGGSTKVMFLDTACEGGVLHKAGFIMRAREPMKTPSGAMLTQSKSSKGTVKGKSRKGKSRKGKNKGKSADQDFTFKMRSADEESLKGVCLAVNPSKGLLASPRMLHLDGLKDKLKFKRQIVPEKLADGTTTTKTLYAAYNSFKGGLGAKMFAFATSSDHFLADWTDIFPILGSLHVMGHVKVIRTAVQQGFTLGGGVKVGGVNPAFEVIVWKTEDGRLIGGELTWGFKCKKGFDSDRCKAATAANLKLFEALSKKKEFLGEGTKTAALMKLGKCTDTTAFMSELEA